LSECATISSKLKYTVLLSLIVCLPFGLADGTREDFAAICRAEPPVPSKIFDNGYEIEYVCDSAGNSDDLLSIES
jgi:hypothetical protein